MMTEKTAYSCRECSRTDLTLTANGKVRSHTANGKRRSEDNPNCPGGSGLPKETTEPKPVVITASGGPNPFRSPLPTGNPPHVHHYRYGDDDNGHSGSFCSCGREEPVAGRPVPPVIDVDTDGASGPGTDPYEKGNNQITVPGAPEDIQRLDSRERSAPDPADSFLGGGRPVGASRISADDFLSGDDEGDDGEAGGYAPRYFPARYDGSCASCGSDFSEGDAIRKGPDGWEAEDCCGESAVHRPERPKAVAKTLPVKNGRYQFPHPETGVPTSGSRASKFGETIADSIALDAWRGRMTVLGMSMRPDLVEKASSVIRGESPAAVAKSRRDYLNKIAEEARQTAGDRDRARNGTVLHKYTEELDAGTRRIEDVPEGYRADASAYLSALEAAGFRPVRNLIERSVFCSSLGVTGTFDRVLECVRDQDRADLNGRPVRIRSGEYVIGDVKSGTNMSYPWMEIQIQEAIYAHAINENGIAVPIEFEDGETAWSWLSLEDQGIGPVREDVGIVMHVPFGEGRCDLLYADLITGWRGAQLCQAIRDFRRESQLPKNAVVFSLAAPQQPEPESPGTLLPDGSRTVFDLSSLPSDTLDGRTYEDRFAAVTSKEEALALYREAKENHRSEEEIKRLVMIGKAALAKLSAPVSGPAGPAPIQVAQPAPPVGPGPVSAMSWHQRAEAVTTRAEASELFRQARRAVMTDDPEMDVAKLNELTSIMRKALARA